MQDNDGYTSWLKRVVATAIDMLPAVVVLVGAMVVLINSRNRECSTVTTPYDIDPYCTEGASTLGRTVFALASLCVAIYLIWNYGHRQGRTGATIGKSLMKFRVLDEQSGNPIGFGKSVVRQLVHSIDAVICYAGYLLPLWDGKKQTFADKIMSTVCRPG